MQPTDTRSTILEAAARLYADTGYAAVSMRDVAREVGVTQANLYHHFNGKDDLIRATLTHVFTRKANRISELLERDDLPGDRLIQFADLFVDLLSEDRVFFRLLARELLDGDATRLRELACAVLERPFRLIAGVSGKRGGQDDDPFRIAASVIALILGRFLISPLLPHLPGQTKEQNKPATVASQVTGILQRAFPHDHQPQER
ncbi:TetR/AcrR family transcriptional regulator [Paracoccus sp. FO-3]|uniref:TetR/AcrR family transcriptional regulator n=1 Tax=Paracoccus sp. FO-3 TaxID=1335059 RepID=UPI001127C9F9|nr:TetR/AcrR family transcriptional regulator [Paracoccus sp. FO-3]